MERKPSKAMEEVLAAILARAPLVNGDAQQVANKAGVLEELERMAIVGVFVHTQGDTTRTARILGVGRTTLYRRIAKSRLEEELLSSRLAGLVPLNPPTSEARPLNELRVHRL